jgi:hypothetical protein
MKIVLGDTRRGRLPAGKHIYQSDPLVVVAICVMSLPIVIATYWRWRRESICRANLMMLKCSSQDIHPPRQSSATLIYPEAGEMEALIQAFLSILDYRRVCALGAGQGSASSVCR